MNRNIRFMLSLLVIPIVMVWGELSRAMEIQGICRVKGMEQNELVGLGLVTGLDGTGDTTKKSKTIIRALAEVYKRNGFIVDSIEDLSNTDSVAVVSISCTVPATGTREGDLLDVSVSTVGDAKDLTGGTLMWTILRAGPMRELYAKASGDIDVQTKVPRKGVIHHGAQMLRDIRMSVMMPGSRMVSLVIDDAYAGFPVADALSNRITQEFALDGRTRGDVWAEADGPKTIILHFADKASVNPSALLSQVLTMNIDDNLLQLPARVLINRSAGVFSITGDVEISPFVVSVRGMTITRITPEPVASAADPIVMTKRQVAIGAERSGSSAARARFQDLIDALEAMDVPFDDRVAILYEMKKIGVLHAKLITN